MTTSTGAPPTMFSTGRHVAKFCLRILGPRYMIVNPPRSPHLHASRSSIDTGPAAPARANQIAPLTIPLQVHSDPQPTRPTASRNLSYDANTTPAMLMHQRQYATHRTAHQHHLLCNPINDIPASNTSLPSSSSKLCHLVPTSHGSNSALGCVLNENEHGRSASTFTAAGTASAFSSVLNRDRRSLNGVNGFGDGRSPSVTNSTLYSALASHARTDEATSHSNVNANVRPSEMRKPASSLAVGALNELGGGMALGVCQFWWKQW
ncbi:hypothetical protein D9619_009474 [Psilocybe cf. subviscida]|uniref:Uncharacterized protein n=1 Tax=Psilocybe cf. subviscida TaxID=2480587 RepID=A0A8H5BTK8_9AGAR|nr:hypothetical protein D9619_009474 [Psilocybe cf. subviscida]